MNTSRTTHDPASWGLTAGKEGELQVCGVSAVDLARQFGTPLHVVHEERLRQSAGEFLQSAARGYPGKTSVHYAFKCNSVPAVAKIVLMAGLKAEVMTPYELDLACRLGVQGRDIIVNGPCKDLSFLRACVDADVRFIVIDSIDELLELATIARGARRRTRVLLRVNPDYVPQGMNKGSATGSRSGCAFGLDLMGGEVAAALDLMESAESLAFEGFHLHIGTGIRRPKDYTRALRCIPHLRCIAQGAHQQIRSIDVGGGFGSPTTRELTTWEMLAYQALGRLPRKLPIVQHLHPSDFVQAIAGAVVPCFPPDQQPELIFEPGRCIVSSSTFLLLTVHRVKTRAGIHTWLITDGGLSTVSLPTYYEYHEVLLASDVNRPRTIHATILGPACFAGDIVYKNKWLPEVRPREVLAVMDSGAYFTGLESSFGFQRSAIVGVGGSGCTLLRRRETLEEMNVRDCLHEHQRQEAVP